MDIIAALVTLGVLASVGLTHSHLIDFTASWGEPTDKLAHVSYYSQLTGVPDNHGI